MSNSRQGQTPKGKNIFSFFKPIEDRSICNEQRHSKAQRVGHNEVGTNSSSEALYVEPEGVNATTSTQGQRAKPIEVDATSSFERDPGLRLQIHDYPINQQDEVRRAYFRMGPYQPIQDYPLTKYGKQNRKFNPAWFKQFPWLEYSPAKDRLYCFSCFLFETIPPKRPAFTIDGFKNWKAVNDRKSCPLLQHMGGPCSPHMTAVRSTNILARPSQQVDNVMIAQTKEEILKNRLHLRITTECIRWLALQGCAFRGHDESSESNNCGNFIELLKFLAKLNEEIAAVVLQNAPRNAMYTSPTIQNQVLHILAERVRKTIREDVGDAKFCILVDEAQDNSDKEQMAIILRFVDVNGFVRERFFGIVGVRDTNASTLKNEIFDVLAHYNLQVQNLRGQGYDGASNMRGAWNGLHALILQECPSAYYVHYFAHRLQLALVAASNDVHEVWLFFSKLSTIVNLIGASPKRKGELHSSQEKEIGNLIASGEVETGSGLNQIGTLQRAGATRWSSHFASVQSLIEMFSAVSTVLESIMKNAPRNDMRGEAKGVFVAMRSFEFVFILHLLSKIMGITNVLCQALQEESQDILNAMTLVSTTKILLQGLRNDGWDAFLENVVSFCMKQGIIVPDLSARYMEGTGRSCQQNDCITLEHHYHCDIFIKAIEHQVMELQTRFTEEAMELLTLSLALDPRDGFEAFNIDDVCNLAEKFYPQDFTKQDIYCLRNQLDHYKLDVIPNPRFQKMTTISELCQGLVNTRKAKSYPLVDRLIRLILTLPVSTATTERAFSAMNLVKTRLRNKMEDEFLGDCMVVYIEREISKDIDVDSLTDEFDSLQSRRIRLR